MTRWLAIGLLGLGLVGAGCTAAEQSSPAPPPPPPPPPAKRELVRWADGICTLGTAIKGVRSAAPQADTSSGTATEFLGQASTWVGDAEKKLADLGTTGLPPADAYASTMKDWLGKLKEQVNARQAPAVVSTLTEFEPKDAELAERTPELRASYDVAPNCTPVGQAGPLRDLVAWSNVMCASVRTLSELRVDPLADPAVSDPRFQQAAWAALGTYITSAGQPLTDVNSQLNNLKPTGIAEADAYRDQTLSAVTAALAKLPPPTAGSSEYFQLPFDQLKAKATEVADIVSTAKPKEPGLDAIVAKDKNLAEAHALAPACERPQQTPTTAADGTDLAACQDGQCQVLITGSADVTAAGSTFKIAVTSSGVTVADATGALTLAPGGEGSFGSGTTKITVKLVSLTGTDAIVDVRGS
ncbi:hypothetical protein [Kibdelosporangium persicum]|uniref:hypothetical protein n=1 Tax=Kibdelosporangium persicum TaxID=2698649 RepID=UPI001564AD99|nr:hypothetical protein [Kibdelosporangium persicum]